MIIRSRILVVPVALAASVHCALAAVKSPALPPLDEAKLLAETTHRIETARTATLAVKVLDADGKPLPNRKVAVEHTKHLFHFGAGFSTALLPRADETAIDQRHRQNFLKIFNYSTIHLYWGGYEPRSGDYQDAQRLRSLAWLTEQGLTARGHPVFWNHNSIIPQWLKELDPNAADLRALMDGRLDQMSRTVLPKLRDVDVWNELVHWERFSNSFTRLFNEQGKTAVVTHYLKEAKRRNPEVLTVVNDYDHSPAYFSLLKQLIEEGAPIDIIGQQSHMHSGNWSVTDVWDSLVRLSLLNRPVLFTEMSVLSGPQKKIDWLNNVPDWNTDAVHEEKQADYLETFYRLAYSHTNCVGVVLWDFSDRRSWLGAPVGVLRKDGSPKPSFEKLDRLINQQWRTRGEFTTDANGLATVPRAFEGEYRISSSGGSASGRHSVRQPLNATLTIR
jgi:endo-1,4-beta-xylanase